MEEALVLQSRDEVRSQDPPLPGAEGPQVLIPPHGGREARMLDKVQAAIEKIRPALQMDGGDIELVSVDDEGTVKVRLQGACSMCPSIQMTMQHGIERSLKEELPEIRQVVNVGGSIS